MVGIIKDEKHVTTSFFKNAGDAVILLGELGDEMGGSHFLKVLFGRKEGVPPRIDFAKERTLHDILRAAIAAGLIKSAHDCAEGGLAVTLAESCMCGKESFGAEIDFGATGLAPEVLLFNETQTRVVLSAAPGDAEALLSLAAEHGVPARRIGTVGGAQLGIKADGAETRWNVADLASTWHGSIAACMA
jgi:phosphoribosylformylglycinamidine synthase